MRLCLSALDLILGDLPSLMRLFGVNSMTGMLV